MLERASRQKQNTNYLTANTATIWPLRKEDRKEGRRRVRVTLWSAQKHQSRQKRSRSDVYENETVIVKGLRHSRHHRRQRLQPHPSQSGKSRGLILMWPLSQLGKICTSLSVWIDRSREMFQHFRATLFSSTNPWCKNFSQWLRSPALALAPQSFQCSACMVAISIFDFVHIRPLHRSFFDLVQPHLTSKGATESRTV